MKRLSMLALLICSHTTFAEPANGAAPEAKTAGTQAAEALVSRDLIQPLAAKDSNASRFSRARLPPQARRVRILDEQPSKDAQGLAFVRFAIDARHGLHTADGKGDWSMSVITGCVYLDRSQVFVQSGDQFRPAAFLLGKNVKPAARTTCQAEQAQVAHAD
jgi:hypothetical protein